MAEVAAIGVGNILVMMQEIVDNETMDQAVADVNSVLDFGGENESLSPEEDKEAEVGAPDVEMQSKIGEQELSIEELVAKARAPIKKEFLTAAGVRVVNPLGGVTGGRSAEQMDRPVISKRQLKKNREQARKSTANICAVVAKTRDPSKCLYGAKCRFNHDLEVYLAQKPPDLPGNCPSLEFGEPCSYSLTCRFAGTHKEFNSLESCEKKASNIPYDERNMLRKDYQKILWKNKGDYPKADAQLQAMGLMGKAFKLNKTEEEERVGPEGGEVIQNTLQLIMGAEAMDTSEGHVDAKLLPPEILKTLRSAIGQVGKSAPVSHASMMSSHPSKRHKSTSDSVTNEDINGSKGDGEEKNVTGAEHMSISAEISPSAMNVGDAATVVPDNRDLAENNSSHQLQHEIEHAKPSANHVDWRILYLESKLPHREKKLIDFRDKLYLAPLTTVGNLPFRRVCKALGADITCGEMAMCRNLLQGAASEWALLRRHSSEDVFGVQICGGYPDHVARTAEMIERECDVDFIDVNVGCPIDLVVNNGAGSCLLTKPQRLEQIVRATAGVMEKPLTLKLRMGYYEGRNCAHSFMPHLYEWGVSAVTIHGRTRQQRYSKVANWDYVYDCTAAAPEDLQVIGNGDIMAYTDWDEHLQTSGSKLATCMIARGALVKPWLFTEIKERRHWDISSSERLDILRKYAYAGLAHWGSDAKGVEVTRKFLLEWLSYMHRYIPVGLLEVVPQRHNWRPPSYFGRNDLETMMASESAVDWIKISEMLLGPVPADFVFQPKHKSNAYDRAENG